MLIQTQMSQQAASSMALGFDTFLLKIVFQVFLVTSKYKQKSKITILSDDQHSFLKFEQIKQKCIRFIILGVEQKTFTRAGFGPMVSRLITLQTKPNTSPYFVGGLPIFSTSLFGVPVRRCGVLLNYSRGHGFNSHPSKFVFVHYQLI